MRQPEDIASSAPRPKRKRRTTTRFWVILAAALVVIVLLSLHSLATLYTDYLWFGSVHLSEVWRRLAAVKLGLFIGFGAVFFVGMWASLAVVDRLAPVRLALGPEDELVRRYQQAVAPRSVLVRTIASLVIAAIAASGTVGQWKHWLLFRDAVSFPTRDPEFHKNVGFFVFTLPFLSYLVGWLFVSLLVITVVSTIAHYLNGGIRVHNGTIRVESQVKAHLSVLLALVALVKAGGYYLQRYTLDFSTQGYVQGAGYTDVHARLPAITLLIWISLAAAAILLYNIYRRGWALPILAVGLWAFVAIVVGAIYPALVQALKVNPAQDVLESPYIARNIAATRTAYSLNSIKTVPFAASTNMTPAEIDAHAANLDSVRVWDPSLTNDTFSKLQAIRSYYSFNTLATNRYSIKGHLTPVVIGVRQLNSADLPAQGWVNVHLQYTHGYGAILSPANVAKSDGNPVFGVDDVPPVSEPGYPSITQPSVYYGVDTPGWVVVDTRQPEIDYQLPNGAEQESHYGSTGGVRLNSFFTRAAFAIRFSDFNLLISNLITSKSRIMFVRGIRSRVAKAAPFLQLGSNPYPVIWDGKILWIQDAYTTSDHYPYSQNADTTALPPTSGLQIPFNYVRNSVKVVVNGYTGKMTFYATDPSDPILRTWERAFPGMFTPISKMPASLRALLRYPKDLFTVQAAMFGRYHITNPQAFYNAGDAWNISQSPGAGNPQAALATTYTTNAQGIPISTGQLARMTPLYETFQAPGQSRVSFNLIDAFVPVSAGDQIQTLSAFMVARYPRSDPGQGQITVYVTPRGESIDGPALIDARITATPSISKAISLLNTNGSSVILGNVLMVPIGQSMLYVRPLYVQSSRNALPELKDVIAVYGTQAAMGTTLQAALQSVFSAPLALGQSSSSSSSASAALSGQEKQLITEAGSLYTQAQAALKAGNLGAYQSDVDQIGSIVSQLEQLSGAVSTGSGANTNPGGSATTSSTASSSSSSSSGGSGSSAGAPHPSSTTMSSAEVSSGRFPPSGNGYSSTKPRVASTTTTSPGEA